MTPTRMLACMLWQKDATISKLHETIATQAVTIRHLKAVLAQTEQELQRAQELAKQNFFSHQLD